jgi:hypothetical protein
MLILTYQKQAIKYAYLFTKGIERETTQLVKERKKDRKKERKNERKKQNCF